MKRYAIIILSVTLVAGAFTAPAIAGSGDKGKAKPATASGKTKAEKFKTMTFAGMVTSVGSDTLTFTSFKGNKAARRWVSEHPGNVTVNTSASRFGGPSGLGKTLGDYRAGDGVVVLARAEGATVHARYVKLVLHAYEGTVASYTAGSSVSVNWTDANRLAEVWMAANGSPNPVSAAITPSTKVRGDMPSGSDVEMRARPAASGSGLEAVSVSGEESVVEAA